MKDATKINGGLLNKTELCHATRNFFSQNQRGEFLPTWLNKQPWSAIKDLIAWKQPTCLLPASWDFHHPICSFT